MILLKINLSPDWSNVWDVLRFLNKKTGVQETEKTLGEICALQMIKLKLCVSTNLLDIFVRGEFKNIEFGECLVDEAGGKD